MEIQQIKEFFDNDKFAKMIDAEIEEITDESVVCTLKINENHFNSVGTVQGGVVFTLADFAFAVACNLKDLKTDTDSVSIGQAANITYLRPAKGDKLIAKTTCIQKGRRISVYRMHVTDNLGTNVAEMTGTAYRIEK